MVPFSAADIFRVFNSTVLKIDFSHMSRFNHDNNKKTVMNRCCLSNTKWQDQHNGAFSDFFSSVVNVGPTSGGRPMRLMLLCVEIGNSLLKCFHVHFYKVTKRQSQTTPGGQNVTLEVTLRGNFFFLPSIASCSIHNEWITEISSFRK